MGVRFTRGVSHTGMGRPTGFGVYWLYMFIGKGTYTGTGTGRTMTLGKKLSAHKRRRKQEHQSS